MKLKLTALGKMLMRVWRSLKLLPIVSVSLLSAKLLIIGVEAYRDWKAEKAKKEEEIF